MDGKQRRMLSRYLGNWRLFFKRERKEGKNFGCGLWTLMPIFFLPTTNISSFSFQTINLFILFFCYNAFKLIINSSKLDVNFIILILFNYNTNFKLYIVLVIKNLVGNVWCGSISYTYLFSLNLFGCCLFVFGLNILLEKLLFFLVLNFEI